MSAQTIDPGLYAGEPAARGGIGLPINLNLELTDLCNIKCRMCGQAHNPKVHNLQPNSFMKWEVWKASIDSLADYEDEVSLCPHWLGEPCLHPDFDRFIRYAFDNNKDNRLFRHFKLHTNGSLLNDERIETLLHCANRKDMAEDTFRFVHFSVDAYSPGVYHEIKKYDYGERVYRNILRLLQKREEGGHQLPRVTNAFIVMPENQHEARWFLDYWTRQFELLSLDFDVVYDWPQRVKDNLYFRRLHQADQAAADRLHRIVLDDLDLLPLDAPGTFIEESF
ncbi:MAG: radical SAM protein [Myxococcota bacterium]|nr:radical SAM protein [Myxococcota bacterium]